MQLLNTWGDVKMKLDKGEKEILLFYLMFFCIFTFSFLSVLTAGWLINSVDIFERKIIFSGIVFIFCSWIFFVFFTLYLAFVLYKKLNKNKYKNE